MNLKLIAMTLLTGTSALNLTASAQGTEQEKARICQSTYEQMRQYSESRPDMAATFGRVFLKDGCGKVFPAVVASVEQYIAYVDAPSDKKTISVAPPNSPAVSAAKGDTPSAARQSATIYSHWVYASGESEGSTTAVYGDLKFTRDGKFEDSRRIGGIGGFRAGSFKVIGDKLTLTFDGGTNSQTYSFSFGTSKDRVGKEFTTLLLRGQGLSFILTEKVD